MRRSRPRLPNAWRKTLPCSDLQSRNSSQTSRKLPKALKDRPEHYFKSTPFLTGTFNVLDMSAKGYCFAVSCFLSGCAPCIDFLIITSLLVNRYKVKQNNWTVDKNFIQFNLISRTVQWIIHLFSFVAEVKSCNFLFGGVKKSHQKAQ